MIQWIAQGLARLCIAVVGLPAVSLECRRAEAARVARDNVALAVGYREEFEDDGDAVGAQAQAPTGGETIDARGWGFGEYVTSAMDDDEDDDEDGQP